MSATRTIEAKHEERRGNGLDLGAAVGPEADAGSGGRVQRGKLARHYNRLQPGGAARIDAVIHGRSDATLPDEVWDGLTTLALRTLGRGRWIEMGTPHFMSGPPDDLLADGVAVGATEAFLKLCAGVDAARPVDLVLCGHVHDRVELRVAWDREAQELRHFTDFYLENPASYYSYQEAGVDGRVHLRIRDGAPLDGQVRRAPDDRSASPYRVRDIPPFPEPLDAAGSPRDWWRRYRPLIVETGPLGPIDRTQRADQGIRPDPSLNGFRLFQVEGGVIEKGRYVTLAQLRANGFVMPFEP